VHLIQNRGWDGAVAVAVALVADFQGRLELPAVKMQGTIGLKTLKMLG
jgi:hypothetical protein